MKVLIVCPHNLDKRLGGSKAYIETFEEYCRLGIDAQIIGQDFFLNSSKNKNKLMRALETKKFIENNQFNYNVIELEHDQIPIYPNWAKGPRPILIGRSTLLTHLVCKNRVFDSYGWQKVKFPIRYLKAIFQGLNSCKYATRSCKNFDYIFCSNNVEVDTLARNGIRKDRMFCFPFGLSKERVRELIQVRKSSKINQKLVGMVGTLDPRKGINFIPKLFDSLIKDDDNIQFKLIGTGGFIPDLKNQYLRFSKKVINQMEIVQSYNPSDLPNLISGYSVGIFPSLVEGCPFGLLEMVGAGIPVIGFDSPGISMILPKENLVPANNLDLFKKKIMERISGAIKEEASFSNQFLWEKICSDIISFYWSLIRDKK